MSFFSSLFSSKKTRQDGTKQKERRPDVRIFAPSTLPFADFFPSNKIPDQLASNSDIRLVEEEEDADLRLKLEEKDGESQIAFELTHNTCKEHGLTQLHESVPANAQAVYRILEGAASFYRHLRPRTSDKALSQSVTVECTRLLKKPREDRMQPSGNNLINEGVMVVDLEDTQSDFYGFKITNTSDLPIYVAVFYFNMGDLSIDPVYLPTQTNGGPVPLCASDGPLTIGYQSSLNTLRFVLPTLRNGELAGVDVGCMKVYLSTEYIDYGHIQQSSPFGDYQSSVNQRQPDLPATLDTTEFTVVIRGNGVDDGRGGNNIVKNLGIKVKGTGTNGK